MKVIFSLLLILFIPFYQALSVYAQETSLATPSAILTEDATAEAKIETEENTNIIGTNNCFIILNLFENPEATVDLSTIMPADCQNSTEATAAAELDISNNNVANINQDIQLTANTGDNAVDIVEGTESQITTGDATASAYLSNVANTNIVGSNTLYGVINIYEPTDKNIILPYELAYTNADGTSSSLPVFKSTNDNQATVENNIEAYAITGNNEADGSIVTGDATVLLRVANNLNTNILNSGFFILQINNLGTWNGSLQGPTVPMHFPESYDPAISARTITNDNQATITNNIELEANTGNNKAAGTNSSISTGNSTIKAFISNIANTTIIGNNWFHMIVNIFDTFNGNIIVPRPDLVTGTASQSDGDNVAQVTIHYANVGTLWAKDVQILVHLPEGIEVLGYSDGAQFDGNRIYWNLGTLEKQQGGSQMVQIKLTNPGTYVISTSISTTTDEPNKGNNGSQSTITVEEPTVVSIPTAMPVQKTITAHTSTTRAQVIQNRVQPPPQQRRVIRKYLPNQLRSLPGEVQSAYDRRPKVLPQQSGTMQFAQLFTTYLFTVMLGIYKLFRD